MAALAVLGACTVEETTVVVPGDNPDPVPVEIEVEVYDPVTNGVWENVGVRVVEAWNEWSGRVVESPYGDFYLTDVNGLAYISPEGLADYEVGFAINGQGQALLGYEPDRDEATVLIEVFADGFDSVFVEVELTWDQPYRFVSVPFR